MGTSGEQFEAWGDSIGTKDQQHVRFGTQNFGGFSRSRIPHDTDKVEDSFRDWIRDGEFDAFSVPEVNVYWPALHPKRALNARLNEWFEQGTTNCSYAFNSSGGFQRSPLQWGGTAQVAMTRLAIRCTGKGRDPTNLGRWTWHRFQGTQHRLFYLYTAYRPVRGPGEFTTYQQHRQFYTQKTVSTQDPTWATKDPRETILVDLALEINKRHEEEEALVILSMDVNQDVRSARIKAFEESAGLINALTQRHGNATMPSTCIKAGRQDKPIDAIFVSIGTPVVQGGIIAGGSGVCGRRADHRCLWIDIPFGGLLGSPSVPIQRFPVRRVKTRDPRVVQKFNNLYQRFLMKHHMHARMFALEQKATQGRVTAKDREEAEKLDRLKLEGIKYADRNCRKLRMGQVEHSQVFQQTKLVVLANCLLVKKKTGGKVGSRKLQRALANAGIQEQLSSLLQQPLRELMKARDLAFKEYWKTRKEAPRLRDQWIEDLAQARALQMKSSKDIKVLTANELRRLRREEYRRQSARRVKHALGKATRNGTIMVSEINEHGETIEHTTKEAIEDCCVRENRRRFAQTHGTPPMTVPVLQEIGLLGDTPQAEAILNGQYQPPANMDRYSRQLFQELGTKIHAPYSAGISTNEFQQGWKRMKEKTSAGRSILHFGHMKAIAQHKDNSAFEASQVSFAMKAGHSFERWKNGIDVEILKKAGVWEVKKLRTIVLFEADFNFVNKFLGRKAMRLAEGCNALAPEQYGSRKRHQASDHALNKWLTFDVIRQLKQPAAICSNDLKSCYDRIVHSIAALCLRRVGISKSETITMFRTLQQLRHVIRTAYGDSSRSYGSSWGEKPLQGIFQGNGGGPPMWATISTPVLNAIRRLGFGAKFITAFSDMLMEFVGYAFVDDTDLLESKGLDWAQTAQDMQSFVTTWKGLLRSTGGALATEKCAWWLLDFHWKDDGTARYKSIEESPALLEVRDADDSIKTIQRKEAHETFDSLGISQRPDGKTDDEYAYLMDAAKTWGNRIRASRLPKEDILYSLKAFALPKLMYGCNVVPLLEKECDKLTSTLLMAALPKAGFNRRFPRAIIHAPAEELGYSLPNLFTHSVASHVQLLLRHGPSNSLSSNLLNASLEYAKVEMGIAGNLFEHNIKVWGDLLSDCWIKKVWHNLHRLPIQLDEGSVNCKPLHSNDKLIMYELVRAEVPMSMLKRLNRCRMFLRVMYWSELVNTAGTCVLPGVLSRHDTFNRHGPFAAQTWPKTSNPTADDWRQWKKHLQEVFHVGITGRLAVPHTGQWSSSILSRSTAWFNSSEQVVIRRQDTGEWQCSRMATRSLNGATKLITLEAPVAVEPTPDRWQPCLAYDVLLRHEPIPVMELFTIDDDQETQVPPQVTLQRIRDTLLTADTQERWACHAVSGHGSLPAIIQALQTDQLLLSTDGSYKHGVGTGAFILSTPEGQHTLFGTNRVPGPAHSQCSLRSELAGICGGLTLIQHLCQLTGTRQPRVLISCDNLEAGSQSVEDTHWAIHPRAEHFDIRRALLRLRDSGFTHIKASFEHIRSHQDNYIAWKDLSVQAQLNCKADLLAKSRWEEERHRDDYLGPLFADEWRVCINQIPITSNVKRDLVHAITVDKLHKWRSAKRKKEQQWTHLWNTRALRQAMTPFTAQHRFITKLSADYLPVGHNMKKWRFWTTDVCPACGQQDETRWHLFQCTDPRMTDTWTYELSRFTKILRDLHTAPFIQFAFLAGLLRWRLDQPPPRPSSRAGQAQNDLGWEQLFMGRVAQAWQEEQLQWASDRSQHIRRRAKSWLPQVISALQHFSFQMWHTRNFILHEEDMPFRRIHDQGEDTDMRIAEEWMLGTQSLMPLDRHLLEGRSIESLLDRPPAVKRQWLRLIQASRDSFELQ